MNYQRKTFLATLLLIALAVPSLGDVPAPPPQGALYLGHGQMLEAAQPRQLSLNAHVVQYLYQPGGLEIAYSGIEQDGNQVTQFVRLAGVKYGKTATLLSSTVHVRDDGTPEESDAPVLTSVAGWSADGRYLLVHQDRFVSAADPAFPGDFHTVSSYTVVDVGADPMRLFQLTIPIQVQGDGTTNLSGVYWWSPNRSHILFATQGLVREGEKHYVADTYCAVYDLLARKLSPVALGDNKFTVGWLDEGHLLLKQTAGGTTHYFNYDMKVQTQTEISKPSQMPARMDDIGHQSAVSPRASYLSLEDEAQHIPHSQKIASIDAHVLWVRRTQGPKPMSAMPVGLTPGKDDSQAQWSPNGQQIAFVAHGDLFVTDISERVAEPLEKYLAGEPLDCQEEQLLAAVSMKQVGLAILQFVQDNDENWPVAADMKDKIKPYLTPDALLSVGGHPFVYHVPPDLALAKMDSPADTVLGTIDLPCAQIVLMADGHVKSISKQGNGQNGANNGP